MFSIKKIIQENKKLVIRSSIILFVGSFIWENVIQSKTRHTAINNTMQLLNMNLEESYTLVEDSTTLQYSPDKLTPKEVVIKKIEKKLMRFLNGITTYKELEVLNPYLKQYPGLLNDIPSMTPLVKNQYVTSSPYGERFHPIAKKNKKHKGYDLASATNNKVYATANGTVVQIQKLKGGYGNNIKIRHRFGYYTRYGHLNKILVEQGAKISQGDVIGLVGSTGASTGPHLHYEIIKNTKEIDPFPSFNLKYNVYMDHLKKQKK